MNENGEEAKLPIEEPVSLAQLRDCLRASFTADNHDSLGDASTRSLLHLSQEAKPAPMRVRLGSER